MSATLLLVDDERDFTELIAYHLRQRGYGVLVARGGQEALNKARRFLPDLIVLDLRLPDLDGYTVCEILRCQPSTKAIPIIMLTALTGQIVRYNALAVGADDFIVKILNPARLIDRIEQFLAKHQERALAAGANGQGDH